MEHLPRVKVDRHGPEGEDWSYYEHPYKVWVVDHILPIALGGQEFNLENLQLLCPECNAIKTAEDLARIAGARRDLHRKAILDNVVPLDNWVPKPHSPP